MSKKGLSADEKRARVLSIFHDSKEFYQLKDVEAEGKKKGVTGMGVVKDLVEEMVADNLIHKEKIGTGNYYWAYPAEHRNALEARINQKEAKNFELRREIKRAKAEIKQAEESRQPTEERIRLLEEYAASKAKADQLEKELARMSALDPDRIGRLDRLVADLRELALHWNDIVSSGLRYLESNGVEMHAMRAEFGIPDDFEDLAFD